MSDHCSGSEPEAGCLDEDRQAFVGVEAAGGPDDGREAGHGPGTLSDDGMVNETSDWMIDTAGTEDKTADVTAG